MPCISTRWPTILKVKLVGLKNLIELLAIDTPTSEIILGRRVGCNVHLPPLVKGGKNGKSSWKLLFLPDRAFEGSKCTSSILIVALLKIGTFIDNSLVEGEVNKNTFVRTRRSCCDEILSQISQDICTPIDVDAQTRLDQYCVVLKLIYQHMCADMDDDVGWPFRHATKHLSIHHHHSKFPEHLRAWRAFPIDSVCGYCPRIYPYPFPNL